MTEAPSIWRIAVPAPLRRLFDYLPPRGFEGPAPDPGVRVRVPFGRRTTVGVLVEIVDEASVDRSRLKPVAALLDEAPLLPESLMRLGRWAATYYHHPPGEVWAAMLPVLLRQGESPRVEGESYWWLADHPSGDPETLKRAPKQQAILDWLAERGRPASAAEIGERFDRWRPPIKALVEKGWVEQDFRSCLAEPAPADSTPPPELNPEQAEAVASVTEALGGFRPFLLEGVTGSGKTEVYLSLIERVLAAGNQALVLVPEIALTPQLVDRFRSRLGVPVGMLHSGLSDRERLCAWEKARTGEARVLLGTRSAVFTPLARPGLLIVDEEHDASFKQQEGFRYSGRDLAAVRGRIDDMSVLFGSATPSLETLNNALSGQYGHLHLTRRAGNARPPRIEVLDVRRRPLFEGVSEPLLERMGQHLEAGGQVLLFINRRGFAPQLICHDCGWVAECRRCDARMTFHKASGRLRCHHCGAERPLPDHCEACGGSDLQAMGQGTERIEQALAARFPEFGLVRIDRDTTRRKGALEAQLEGVRAGRSQILVGTQMLAKGHDFPDVTLVGVLGVDRGLFGIDFRSSERVAQVVMQVAGRAGRARRPGEVVIQTHHPDHPLLQALVTRGYGAFARSALAERREAGLPPASHLCLIRAESPDRQAPARFLEAAARAFPRDLAPSVEVLGPVVAPMERIAGRYRMQLLVQDRDRAPLHRALDRWLPVVESLPEGRRVRWSLDVDPQDLW